MPGIKDVLKGLLKKEAPAAKTAEELEAAGFKVLKPRMLEPRTLDVKKMDVPKSKTAGWFSPQDELTREVFPDGPAKQAFQKAWRLNKGKMLLAGGALAAGGYAAGKFLKGKKKEASMDKVALKEALVAGLKKVWGASKDYLNPMSTVGHVKNVLHSNRLLKTPGLQEGTVAALKKARNVNLRDAAIKGGAQLGVAGAGAYGLKKVFGRREQPAY